MKSYNHPALVFALCCMAGLSLLWSASVYSESYSYDSSGRLTGVTYDDGTSISYTYDNAGNLLQQLVNIPDVIPPNAPIVTGTTPTNLSMPTWNWSSGGNGGNGTFRYKLDDSDLTTAAIETTSTTFTPSNALSVAIHTLYVQERDDAANWSNSGSFAITVLENTPPMTTASPAGGTYTSIQSVILNCDDGTGSGCANTHFTTDGSDPTTSSSVYATALSISVDTPLKFFSVDSAGNSETVKTEDYVIQIPGSNNPPALFALVFPVDGATDLPASIPLIWKQATDPDGDTLSYQVIYCDNAAFTGCSAQTVAVNTQDMILVASVAGPFGGLFMLGLVFSGSRKIRFKKQLAFIAILLFLSGLAACGGGGSDPDDPVLPTAAADEKQLDINSLTSATTYYWKVTADDGNGGLTDSETRSFTTQ